MRVAIVGALLMLGLAAGCGEDAGGMAAGRHFGYVQAVDVSSTPATLEIDAADFLTGEEASDAAEEDGAIAEGEGVPNDYYIRNDDETTDTLDVAAEVRVTRFECVEGCVEDVDADFATFASGFDVATDDYRGAESQYWLTLEDGEVVAIDELYLP